MIVEYPAKRSSSPESREKTLAPPAACVSVQRTAAHTRGVAGTPPSKIVPGKLSENLGSSVGYAERGRTVHCQLAEFQRVSGVCSGMLCKTLASVVKIYHFSGHVWVISREFTSVDRLRTYQRVWDNRVANECTKIPMMIFVKRIGW